MAEALAVALIATGSEAAIVAGFAISGSAALVNATLVIAASSAYSAQQSSAAKRKARDQFNDSLRDREVMVRSGVAPQRIIYGRDRVSGPVVYAESSGSKKEFLHLVIALAAHECDAIESIYFNDILLPTPDGSGYINSGEFYDAKEEVRAAPSLTANGSGVCTLADAATAVHGVFVVTGSGEDGYSSVAVSYAHTPGSTQVTGLTPGGVYSIDYSRTASGGSQCVRVKKYLGTSSQTADADLVSESAGKWLAAHRGRGICYLYVRLKYDQDVFGQIGIPNISCVVKGKKVYDPRSGLTVWSDNAALCVADYLRDARFGLGATSAQVPASELTTAANLCDEVVALDGVGGTQLRYTMNGSFTADASPLDALTALSTSMAGAAVWTQGRWYVRPGAYRTATVTISEDSLADGAIVTAPKAPRTELFNAVRVTHRDPARDYSEVQAPLVSNATYQTADGGVQIVRDIKLPFACDPMRAQRLGKIELERNRQALTLKVNANLKAYDLAPTDTAAVTLTRYGWSSKAFEVVERTWNGGTLEYVLRETAAGVFDWAYGEATTVDLAPDTTLPNPHVAPATLSGFTVASGTTHLARNIDGTIMTRAFASWTQSTEQFVIMGGQIQVEWKRGRDELWTGSAPLHGDSVSTYLWPMRDGDAINVRIRPVNERGRAGNWTYYNHDVIGKTAPPSNVTGLGATQVTGAIKLYWNPSTDADYSETELRQGGANWAAGTRIFKGSASEFPWVSPAQGTYTVRARQYDTSGNESTSDASVSVTVDAGVLVDWTAIDGRPSDAAIYNGEAGLFFDGFETDALADWTNLFGSGELSRVSITDGVSGGYALRVGNFSGNDQAWLQHNRNIPFDPSALYRVKARIRLLSGGGTVYVGLNGVAANGTALVNINGADDAGYQYFCAASGATPATTPSWTEYVGYMRGTAGTGTVSPSPDPSSPSLAHTSVRYIRPVMLINYNAASGSMEVDYFSVERLGGAIGTAQLGEESATIIATDYVDSDDRTSTSTYHLICSASITNNDTVSRTVLVSGTSTMAYPNGIPDGNVIRGHMIDSGTTTTSGNFKYQHTVTTGEDRRWQWSAQEQVTVSAGATITWQIWGWASNYTSTMYYERSNIRLELIKR